MEDEGDEVQFDNFDDDDDDDDDIDDIWCNRSLGEYGISDLILIIFITKSYFFINIVAVSVFC